MRKRYAWLGLGLGLLALTGAVAREYGGSRRASAGPTRRALRPVSAAHVAAARAAQAKSPSSALQATNELTPASADWPRLRDDLRATDLAERLAAIEGAASAGFIEALPVLQETTLAHDPEAAPTIIRAVAELATIADAPARERAASKLAEWLHGERTRTASDARGNTSLLVDALGAVGGEVAVEALIETLESGDVALHVETRIVEQLLVLDAAGAAPALARFLARVEAEQFEDAFREELRAEAMAAARAAQARFVRRRP